jgi:hypothetical protein
MLPARGNDMPSERRAGHAILEFTGDAAKARREGGEACGNG